MADGKGSKTEADPESFTVEDGRLYVFYDGFWGDTRKSWRKGGGATWPFPLPADTPAGLFFGPGGCSRWARCPPSPLPPHSP